MFGSSWKDACVVGSFHSLGRGVEVSVSHLLPIIDVRHWQVAIRRIFEVIPSHDFFGGDICLGFTSIDGHAPLGLLVPPLGRKRA